MIRYHLFHRILEDVQQKPSVMDGDSNNTLMAYVCDVPRSQQALLSRAGLCAELAKCFVTEKI